MNHIYHNDEGNRKMTVTAPGEEARAAFKRDVNGLHLLEFWELRSDIESRSPKVNALPYCWKWTDIEPRLRVAARTVPIEDCERRALLFSNPGCDGRPHATHTLLAACSLYNPGERAPVHRHTPSASRFVLEGDGGFTVVEGEKLRMHRGDLILTPPGTWHDHGNDGQQAVIWIDVLNVPLVEALNATQFEFDYFEKDEHSNSGMPLQKTLQTIAFPDDYSQSLYGTGGIVPLFVSHRRGPTEHSPMFVYRWEQTRTALKNLESHAGSPHDGIICEYVDPTTGGPVMPTMSFRSQMLRGQEHTLAHRKTSSTVYCVLEGEGYTQVEDVRLEWRRNDVFAVPSWHWHCHVNNTRDNAFLYSVTDEPAMRKLGLFREEGRSREGKTEVVVR
jgi:gentisate 1,2-dioxygenase